MTIPRPGGRGEDEIRPDALGQDMEGHDRSADAPLARPAST